MDVIASGADQSRALRGVPTVEQAGAVSLFTADLVIWLGVGNPQQAAAAAAALAEVGNRSTVADLPAPPERNAVLVDTACGAGPGSHGRMLPN